MRELALFAGAGGGILGGVLLGWRTVCAVEIDPYCRSILLARQRDVILPEFPIWDDARTFDGKPWRGSVDVVSASPPCQPHSCAGKKLGAKDPRNMWPRTIEIISDVKAPHVLFENVPGIAPYLPTIIRDLRRLGYAVDRPIILPASIVGAPHLRRRVWLGAHANGHRLQGFNSKYGQAKIREGEWADIARVVGEIQRGVMHRIPASWICRGSDGVAHRVDRLRALGNGQVPAVVRLAWETLGGAK